MAIEIEARKIFNENTKNYLHVKSFSQSFALLYASQSYLAPIGDAFRGSYRLVSRPYSFCPG